jgi:hypothetical protein
MADLYDDMVKKAQFFKQTTEKIFESQNGGAYASFRYI